MKPKEEPHVCKFMKTCRTLDTLYPPHQKYSKIRRKFRELFLVSEENGRRCYTPQGNAGYIYQKEKQLTQSFHVIHPYSKFCEYWKIFAIIEYCISYPVRSFLVTLFPHVFMQARYQIPSLLSDLFQTADVWLRFNIGYVDREMQEIVLESRKIVHHTIKRCCFYSDAIVSFPIEFSVYLYTLLNGPPQPVFQYCVLLKILKIYTIARYLTHMGKIYNWGDLSLRIVWMVFLNVYFSHFICCGFHLIVRKSYFDDHIPHLNKKYHCFYYYIRIFYAVTCAFFGAEGLGDNAYHDTFRDKCYYAFMILLQNFNSVIFNGTFLHLLASTRNSKILFDEMKQEVQKFLAQENLPKYIHLRVVKYLNFRYCHSYFNEQLILGTLSPPLRREVLKFLCFKLIKRPYSIFNTVPDEIATDLCLHMKLEYFLPGDTVFRVGGKSKYLYFLYSGSVAVYNPQGRECIHWYEGQQFGMSSFLQAAVHPVTVIALEMTELYLLPHKDFMNLVGVNPEFLRHVKDAALSKIRDVTGLFDFEIKEFSESHK